jgi:hypothetical protein
MMMRDSRWLARLGVTGLVVLGGCAASYQMGGSQVSDAETSIILYPSGSTCEMTWKAPTIRGKSDKRLDFEVLNHCGATQTVMVGNFRPKDQASSSNNCDTAREGIEPIFKKDDPSTRTAMVPAGNLSVPMRRKIRLKFLKGSELPGTDPTLELDFDVCLNGAKADPRLIIER